MNVATIGFEEEEVLVLMMAIEMVMDRVEDDAHAELLSVTHGRLQSAWKVMRVKEGGSAA